MWSDIDDLAEETFFALEEEANRASGGGWRLTQAQGNFVAAHVALGNALTAVDRAPGRRGRARARAVTRSPRRRQHRHGHDPAQAHRARRSLSIVEHLTELRTRIIICVVGFSLAFGICLWQEDRILEVVNKPLADVANAKPCDETRDPLEQADCWQQSQRKVNERLAAAAGSLAAAADDDPDLRRQAEALEQAATDAVNATPQGSKKLPVTLGVGEPLTATMVAAGYTALLIVLPLILSRRTPSSCRRSRRRSAGWRSR